MLRRRRLPSIQDHILDCSWTGSWTCVLWTLFLMVQTSRYCNLSSMQWPQCLHEIILALFFPSAYCFSKCLCLLTRLCLLIIVCLAWLIYQVSCSFVWLELVSHRSFMPKLLTCNGQKGWPYIQRLLVDLFQFMEPFLRNAELTEPVWLVSSTFKDFLFLFAFRKWPFFSQFVYFRYIFSIKGHSGCCWCCFMISQNFFVIIISASVMSFFLVAYRCEI